MIPEKIYVHFDKPFYNPGDQIWFKGYIQQGLAPSDLSRNFYAELSDSNGQILARLVAPVMESSAAGSFSLPDSAIKAPLIFRAYTLGILRNDPDRIFSKPIPVSGQQPGRSPDSVSLRFFPEGGNLVSGIRSRLAFSFRQGEFPIEGSGEILDPDGRKIADFSSEHDGMGAISFTPKAGRYTARWKTGAGQMQSSIVPVIQPQGVVLRTERQSEGIRFTVTSTLPGSNTFFIRGTMNNRLLYSARLTAGSAAVQGIIPDSIAVTGIFQVTLLNAQLVPVAERVLFIHRPDDFFEPGVQVQRVALSRRGRNELIISRSDTLKENLSVSITAVEAVPVDSLSDNILSHLFLSGELRGYIHQPGYYFSKAPRAEEHLDLLMLTHGWRKYNSVIQGRYIAGADDYLSFRGQVINYQPGNIPADQTLTLIVQYKDTSMQIIEAQIGADGSFQIDQLAFYDTAKIYYSFNKNRALNNRARIELTNNLFKGKAGSSGLSEVISGFIIDDAVEAENRQIRNEFLAAADRRARQYKLLETVTIQARRKSEQQRIDERYTRGMFRGGNSRSFDLVNDPASIGFYNIFQYLQGRVAGLQIMNSFGMPRLNWRGGSPALFLDEMRVDASMIANIPITDVAYIKVFSPPFMGGFGGGSGAIAVYTRRGDESVSYDTGGLAHISVEGYSAVKEFYSPDYATNSPLNQLPDLRTTILWNPYVVLDSETRSQTLRFYNNDFSRKLQVVIEGIDASGRPGRKVLLLQ